MDVLLIIYNIGLFILFSVVATLGIITYLRKKRLFFLTVAFFFIFLIINNILIYLTEQVPWFSDGFDQIFMTTPSPKIILVVAHSICLVLILDAALQAKIQPWQYGLMIGQTLMLLFIPMLPNNAFKVWIFYFPSEIVRMSLAIYGLRVLKQSEKDASFETAPHIDIQITNLELFKKMLVITLIMTVIITLEDTFVIFFHDTYTMGNVHMTNRSFSEDILAVIYASITLTYLTKYLLQPVLIEAGVPDDCVIHHHAISQTQKFGYHYHMTSREIEVLTLLLANKNNQEISNELFISMGTVKSHIHNIFMKLDITKRHQIQNLYDTFETEQQIETLAT